MSRPGFEQVETDRRLANMIRIGTVDAVEGATATVKIGDYVTPMLPMMAHRAGDDRSWHSFEPGEQVVVLSPSGEPAAGVIVGSYYSDERPAPYARLGIAAHVFKDGCVIAYDRDAKNLLVQLPDGGTVDIKATGGITITGDVTITGKVTASNDVIAAGISLKTHTHTGVTAGGGKTGKPL